VLNAGFWQIFAENLRFSAAAVPRFSGLTIY
jgi:hypothetical protein